MRAMGESTVIRAFKYRFYPTKGQADELERTFGCVRKVYNLALEARSQSRRQGVRLSYGKTSSLLTEWKKSDEYQYLREVSCVPLQQALRHLQMAFAAFGCGRARYPRFKSRKRSRASAEYTRSAFRFRDGELVLAKMNAPLAIVWSRPLPPGANPSTVTVSKDSAGRWFVSLRCEDPTIVPCAESMRSVGIDVGVSHLLVLSTGEKIDNPRHERRERSRLSLSQRRMARKTKGSRNYEKAQVRVARIHARVSDRRRDALHKLTTRLVRENQTLVIEDVSVRNLVQNRRLARSISDAAWREFRTLLEYKARWYGRRVIAVDRWFPSSKLCSNCGLVREALPLDVRWWTCEGCGVTHDRDVNAALNILAAGRAVTVCGDDVRPQRDSPGGRLSTKQKPEPARALLPVCD